jgi:SAM-dependent MidA family methyltransferase
LLQLVGERGPLTVAAFMDLALYHPHLGYYARAAQRSGKHGDFFTSVDVGPLFGQLLEVQLAEMHRLLSSQPSALSRQPSAISHQPLAIPALQPFDLVEAGAGNGRLSADILRAARDRDPDFYRAVRLHLVEASAEARDVQRATLGDVGDRLCTSRATLPDAFEGALVANELLDAMPVHQVVMREDGLREVYVALDTSTSRLQAVEGPPSTAELAAHLERIGVALEPGWRAEIGLAAIDWIRQAARRLTRGFMLIIDYGHEARELYSLSHASGTLTTYSGHRSSGPESPADCQPSWLQNPGEQDMTAHVDFTSVRAATEAEGMTTIGFLDQTYFLLGLVPSIANAQRPVPSPQSPLPSPQPPIPAPQSPISDPQPPVTNLQPPIPNLKTLIMPGGLGSTMKVLILGKGVGAPALAGCSFKVRVT